MVRESRPTGQSPNDRTTDLSNTERKDGSHTIQTAGFPDGFVPPSASLEPQSNAPTASTDIQAKNNE